MANIIPLVGFCSVKNRETGFQFVQDGTKLTAKAAFRAYGGGDEIIADVSGEFYTAPTFKCTCGNKHLYQCSTCGKFVCYDGNEQTHAYCPYCHSTDYVPAADSLGRIARSGRVSDGKKTDIVLAIDVSKSMTEDGRMETVKRAAVEEFVSKYEGRCRMALISFSTKVTLLSPLTDDLDAIKRLIGGLSAGGSTSSPFGTVLRDKRLSEFLKSDNNRYLVVFTDGEWSGEGTGHISSANKIKDKGVKILSIGCAGADKGFLERISSPDGSIVTTDAGIRSAFATIAEKSSQ